MYDQAILLGVVLSLLFYEITGLSAAGVIVPAYFALSLHSPMRMVYTIMIAVLAMLAVKGISRYTILYGRRRFGVSILVAYALSLFLGWLNIFSTSFSVIGCLIPGIMAREMDRQGIGKTILSLAVVTAILALLLTFFGYQVVTW